MQIYRDLYIRGEPDQLAATTEEIRALLSGDWSRDADAEEKMHALSLGRERPARCFLCQKRVGRPAATVFLVEKEEDVDYVANIVPHESHELSYAEYNGLMEEFFNQFVRPAATRTGATAELTEPEADLEHWVSADTGKKLRLFCLAANKRTGASHPADRKLWNDFILAVHREGAQLSSSVLARWLHEVGGWDEEWADELAIQYEYARDLLAQADSRTVGV